MNETSKTVVLAVGALVLGGLALVTAPEPVTPDAFSDVGEAFFAEFTDPNEAITLEIIDFDEATAAARPFKVTFKDPVWTIPSHHDYPADAKDRLARTAAGVIGIAKDDFRGDAVTDHEACGVLGPLDDNAVSLKGRGRRVTFRGKSDKVLADFIVGKEVEGREGFHFVRLPEQKRVYVAKLDAEISSEFHDWIERDLLNLTTDDVAQVVIKDYSINEQTMMLDDRDTITLDKAGNDWSLADLPDAQELDKSKVTTMVTTLDSLQIEGVRPKPEGLSRDLRQVEQGLRLSNSDMLSLQGKGYYVTQDGSLKSNEGEVNVRLADGAVYSLRFGEVLYGSGLGVTAGADGGGDGDGDSDKGPGENRYLFVTAEVAAELKLEPPAPTSTDFASKDESEWSDEDRENRAREDAREAWQQKLFAAQQHVDELNDRFADWYYVISAESFDKLRLRRTDLAKAKDS